MSAATWSIGQVFGLPPGVFTLIIVGAVVIGILAGRRR